MVQTRSQKEQSRSDDGPRTECSVRASAHEDRIERLDALFYIRWTSGPNYEQAYLCIEDGEPDMHPLAAAMSFKQAQLFAAAYKAAKSLPPTLAKQEFAQNDSVATCKGLTPKRLAVLRYVASKGDEGAALRGADQTNSRWLYGERLVNHGRRPYVGRVYITPKGKELLAAIDGASS